jgi:hypothetical protein
MQLLNLASELFGTIPVLYWQPFGSGPPSLAGSNLLHTTEPADSFLRKEAHQNCASTLDRNTAATILWGAWFRSEAQNKGKNEAHNQLLWTLRSTFAQCV